MTTSDLRIRAVRPLVSPAVLAEELPLDDAGADSVAQSRRAVEDILAGRDDRLLALVGPCSIHDPAAACEYGERLRELATLHAAELFVVMRVYFEKPRTVVGWKGLINDPGLDGSFQINQGLRLARKLMIDLAARQLPVATEFLDTTLGQFYAELVTWGGIGARTVESQVHRELASGLSMPVGFKNRTDGNVQVAIDAIRSARHPHWFPSLTKDGVAAVLGTAGNDSGEPVRAAAELLRAAELPPYLVIDCSHANCGKNADVQPAVAAEIAAQLAAGERAICGVMLESNLLGGAQDYRQRPLVYGQSVTDPCLSLEKTIPVLAGLAAAVRARRARS
jgi:3-deoxy-7-phosphoheptulonate synthase